MLRLNQRARTPWPSSAQETQAAQARSVIQAGAGPRQRPPRPKAFEFPVCCREWQLPPNGTPISVQYIKKDSPALYGSRNAGRSRTECHPAGAGPGQRPPSPRHSDFPFAAAGGNSHQTAGYGCDTAQSYFLGQEHPNVLSYIDVLKHRKPVGEPVGELVAVIGAGGIGFDVLEYLLHYGGHNLTAKEVSLLEFWQEWGIDPNMKKWGGLTQPLPTHVPKCFLYLLQRKKGKLGAELGKTTGWIHCATLNNSGKVKMINSVTYNRIDKQGHLYVTQNGTTKHVLEVNNIVICAGQVEYHELEEAAAQDPALKDRVYTIGGAYAAGELDAKRAIDMGTRLALKIHEPEVVPGRHVFSASPGFEEQLFNMMKRFM